MEEREKISAGNVLLRKEIERHIKMLERAALGDASRKAA